MFVSVHFVFAEFVCYMSMMVCRHGFSRRSGSDRASRRASRRASCRVMLRVGRRYVDICKEKNRKIQNTKNDGFFLEHTRFSYWAPNVKWICSKTYCLFLSS